MMPEINVRISWPPDAETPCVQACSSSARQIAIPQAPVEETVVIPPPPELVFEALAPPLPEAAPSAVLIPPLPESEEAHLPPLPH